MTVINAINRGGRNCLTAKIKISRLNIVLICITIQEFFYRRNLTPRGIIRYADRNRFKHYCATFYSKIRRAFANCRNHTVSRNSGNRCIFYDICQIGVSTFINRIGRCGIIYATINKIFLQCYVTKIKRRIDNRKLTCVNNCWIEVVCAYAFCICSRRNNFKHIFRAFHGRFGNRQRYVKYCLFSSKTFNGEFRQIGSFTVIDRLIQRRNNRSNR